MAADINDKLRKYKSLFSTTLSGGIGTGTGDTITPATVTGLPTDTAISLTFDRVDSGGVPTPAKLERIKGIVNGGNFIDYLRGRDNTTEQAHIGGAVIEMVWNAEDWNDMIDWALTQHNQDGTHSDITADSVTTTSLNISSINDTNGNEAIKIPATSSAVNEVTVTNAATGNAPTIEATGDDTNIDLVIKGKGTGVISVAGTTDYEDNVTDDDDIPNKKYVDSLSPDLPSIKRVVSIASSSSPTPDADTTDQYVITALAENATFGAPTGTPVNGQALLVRVKDNGTGRTLAFNAIYRAVGVTLPTTTTSSKTMYLGFIYNTADTKWDCISAVQET